MEEEIDLRPHVRAIARRWPLLLASIMACSIVAAIAIALVPQPSRAQADLFISPRTPELSLDPRFTDRDATIVSNPVYQRQALIDLATSPALEASVAQQLGKQPGQILEQLQVVATSDLLQVVASAPTQEEAVALAEAWALAYEDLVGELYSGAEAQSKQLEADLAEAQQRFEQAQSSLDTFYAGGELVRAEQQVQRLDGLLQGGVEAQVSLYTQYLTRTQELNLILEDARALQAQFKEGGASDLSASLAALAVRARLAGAEQLPVQLSFGSAESFAEAQASSADLERFVSVLEGERDRMVAAAAALAGELAGGNSAVVGLSADVRARYEQELAAARGALARAGGQEEQLLQQQRLALASLEVLQSRADELRIDRSMAQVNLRMIGVAPVRPGSILVQLVAGVGAAAVVGAILGIALALLLERAQWRRTAPAGSTPAPTGERPTDQPVATD